MNHEYAAMPVEPTDQQLDAMADAFPVGVVRHRIVSELGEVMFRGWLAKIYTAAIVARPGAEPAAPTRQMQLYRILRNSADRYGCVKATIPDLVSEMGVTRQRIYAMIESLQKRGMVARHDDELFVVNQKSGGGND